VETTRRNDGLFRMLDANANRAREALRVIEDVARFVLDDAELAGEAKAIRHALGAALSVPAWAGRMVAARDTPHDVGRAIEGSLEHRRPDIAAIATAAGKRLSEALRSIEECCKALDGGAMAAREIEAARYAGYEVEKRIVLALGTGRARQWAVCVVVTERLCTKHPWDAVARMALEGGAECLQLREKDLDTRELVRRAKRLVDLAQEHDAVVVVNDRVDVALASGAHGVHLGEHDLPVGEARRIAGFSMLIGVTTHDIPEAEDAMRDGADYCGVGQMFPTATKQRERATPIEGPAFMRAYAAHDPPLPPHLAIGGISADNVGIAVEAGARGVAASGAVCGAPDPRAATAALVDAVRAGHDGGLRERTA
jgi:thiamine-phosphate pyrophosphorylase